MTRYTEDEIAAEEERFGGKLPDDLRQRYLDGVPEVVVITGEDGEKAYFTVWGPPGMTKETQEVRDTGEDFLSDDALVAWAEDTGDLAVVTRDGTLAWWRMRGGDLVGIDEIDWDPSQGELAEL